MIEIKGESYTTTYNSETATITCQGSFRLRGAEYDGIMSLLNDVVAQEPKRITMNLQELKFLNSSGINMLSKFVINVRNKKVSQLTIQGSKQIPWQRKSLRNLPRLMPNLQLEFTE